MRLGPAVGGYPRSSPSDPSGTGTPFPPRPNTLNETGRRPKEKYNETTRRISSSIDLASKIEHFRRSTVAFGSSSVGCKQDIEKHLSICETLKLNSYGGYGLVLPDVRQRAAGSPLSQRSPNREIWTTRKITDG